MENTMMNVHICSTRKTDEPLMLNVFKAYKLNRGFVPCEPDEADQTYLVSYLVPTHKVFIFRRRANQDQKTIKWLILINLILKRVRNVL